MRKILVGLAAIVVILAAGCTPANKINVQKRTQAPRVSYQTLDPYKSVKKEIKMYSKSYTLPTLVPEIEEVPYTGRKR